MSLKLIKYEAQNKFLIFYVTVNTVLYSEQQLNNFMVLYRNCIVTKASRLFLAAKRVVQKSDKNHFQFGRGELLFRRPYVS